MGDQAEPAEVAAVLDAVLTGADPFPAPVADPLWTLVVEGFDPSREREVESWFTLANGRTGTRGSIEEGTDESAPAVYVAGVFGSVEGDFPGPDLLAGPQWARLWPRVGTDAVTARVSDADRHVRILDLRQGILFRRWETSLPSGRRWQFRSARFASLADRALLALQAEASCSGAEVSLGGEVPIDEAHPTIARVEQRSDAGRRHFVVQGNGGGTARFVIEDREEDGRLSRLVAVERCGPGGRAPDPAGALDRLAATEGGIAELRDRHRRAWAERWAEADIEIEGETDLQRGIRFSLFHLISSGDPDSDLASVGARGLTGPGYLGHVFWDTEVFVLPFFIWTHPPTARALLSYRHRTLPAARAKAAGFGYQGALFAWESADTGQETTPDYVDRPDGMRIRILTGAQEHHISADVAWAAWQYWNVTGDDGFLIDMGAELIVETARFWASRVRADDAGRYHIDEVIGPDEYHEGVDDNAFTNILARWNLRTAIEVGERLSRFHPAAWDTLRGQLGLTPEEPQRWRAVADGLVDGFDGASLLYEQCAGFFAMEDIRAVDLAPRPFAGDMLLPVARVRQAQMVKQADVLMMAHMLPDLMPAEVLAANYRYYEPRTSHGSSLSPAIHAAVAARVGAFEEADRYLRMAAAIDLDDRMGNSANGLHLATMGGLWQAAVLGFGGVRADGDALRIDPRRPGLAFPLRWRGTRVRVRTSDDTLQVELDGPATVAAGDGPPSVLGAGRFLARGGPGRWSALEAAP